jgi:hypothetical protein
LPPAAARGIALPLRGGPEVIHSPGGTSGQKRQETPALRIHALIVGDGINDGPGLAAAEASIAPGSASDVRQRDADSATHEKS